MKTDRPELDEYYAAFDDDEMREIARADLEANYESPRGMVLILASLLEIGLERLLRNRLGRGKSTKELFDGPNAPLGSLSSKISLSRSLDLVSEQEYKNLTAVRKIRNKFAHELFSSFENKDIADQAYSLDISMENLDQNEIEASIWFRLSCSALNSRIYDRNNFLSDLKQKETTKHRKGRRSE